MAAAWLLAATAASQATTYVPATIHGGFPAWLSGPLHGLHFGRLSSSTFQDLVLAMCAGYIAVLASARSLSLRAVAIAVVAAHVGMLLCPPLLSQDVFGYLDFARLGALHGLDPYTHFSTAASGDAVFPFVGWKTVASPYGPLFTLASYGVAGLGVGGGLWALKISATVFSLVAVALVARAAAAGGGSAPVAAAFMGLNPVLLVFALGGFHNDALVVALIGAALLAVAARTGARARIGVARWGTAACALALATAVKVSAGLPLAFLVLGPPRWRERLRTAAIAGAALVALAIVALIGFGPHAFGFFSSVRGEQQMVATHSIPNETAQLLGVPALHQLPAWWRDLYLVVLVIAVAGALWRTAQGADWRVCAGWATLAMLVCTAWLLPWYAVWVLPFAAVVNDRRLRTATLIVCAYAVCIRLPLASGLLGGRRS